MTLKLGEAALPLSLPSVDGKKYQLDDFGKSPFLVVAWWCNHCPYVQAWERRFVALAKEYQGKGVAFVAINSNETVNHPTDDFDHMVDRANRMGYVFPYLRDESQAVAKAYGPSRTPELFVFDAARRLRYHGAIDDNHEDPRAVKEQYLRNALDALLAGKDPPLKETRAVGCSVKWAT